MVSSRPPIARIFRVNSGQLQRPSSVAKNDGLLNQAIMPCTFNPMMAAQWAEQRSLQPRSPSVLLQGDEGSIRSTPAKEAFRAMKIQPVEPSIILSYMNCCPARAHCASPPTELRPKMETEELDCCISTRRRGVTAVLPSCKAGVSFKVQQSPVS